MSTATQTKSIIVERTMPHSPGKIWRALTQAPMIAEWLMKNDFKPEPGHKFQFRATPMPGWSGITNCEVKEVVENQRLVYTWGDGSESDSGLKTVVTWSLTPEGDATRVRMEQSGFRPEDARGFTGMGSGWPRIVEQLERVVAGLD